MGRVLGCDLYSLGELTGEIYGIRSMEDLSFVMV